MKAVNGCGLGLFWGLLTGLMIASYTVLDAYVVKVMLLSPILFNYCENLTRLPYAAIPAWKQRHTLASIWKRQWKYALIVGALSPVGYVMVLFAMKIAPLSHVAPAREMSMLFAALIGGQLFAEGDRALRIAGAVIIAVGVACLALAK